MTINEMKDHIKTIITGRYIVRTWDGELITRTNSLAEAVAAATEDPDYWVEDSERGMTLEWILLPEEEVSR